MYNLMISLNIEDIKNNKSALHQCDKCIKEFYGIVYLEDRTKPPEICYCIDCKGNK